MRLAVLLSLIAAASGCAAPAPVAVSVPPPTARVAPPPPAPVSVAAPAEVVDLAPLDPLTAPKLRIDRRAIYERDGVAEWALANGLTVVFLHTPDAPDYRVRVQGPRGWADVSGQRAALAGQTASWGPLRARVEVHRRVATGEAASLGEAVAAVAALFSQPPTSPESSAVADAFDRPASFHVVLAGPASSEWVEPVIATVLATLPSRDPGFGPAIESVSSPEAAVGIAADWDDLPVLAVVNQIAADGAAAVVFDPTGGVVRFGPGADAARFASVGEEAIRAACARAARAAATVDARLAALADLYELPGAIRPARRPAEATRLADRIERTPPARVAEWLERLREARQDPSSTPSHPTD